MSAHLDLESIVVVERAARSPEPTMPGGLEVFREDFSETAIHFVQLVEGAGRGLEHAGEERTGALVLRVVEDLIRRTLLEDLTAVEHHHPV